MSTNGFAAGAVICLLVGVADLVLLDFKLAPEVFEPSTKTGSADPAAVAQIDVPTPIKPASTEPGLGGKKAPATAAPVPGETPGTATGTGEQPATAAPEPSPTTPTEPAKAVTPSEPVKPSDEGKPTTPAEPAKPLDEGKPATPAEPAKPPDEGKPATPAEPVKPTAVAAKTIVRFPTASSQLTAETMAALGGFIRQAQAQPDAVILVEGHADQRGEQDLNQRLSLLRAASVAAFLKKEGLPPAQLRVRGLGSMHPKNPENTPAAWAENRRVELRIRTKQKSHP